ncbi:MAG: hypothetical protein MJE77_02115 [Proteobacteria bacterium]|nr:hypothetical protein [Pseudomonadota bacterium]
MRILGIMLFVFGSAAAAYCTWAVYRLGRPKDVVFGILAPVAMILALLGLLSIFVPGFLG